MIGFGSHLSHAELARVADRAVEQSRLRGHDRRHLESCERCSALLAGHREAASLLRLGGTDAALPLSAAGGAGSALTLATVAVVVVVAVLGVRVIYSQAAPGAGGTGSSVTPTMASPTIPDGDFAYQVRPGDQVLAIAVMFNLEVSELEAANPQVADFDHLAAGSTLVIPPPRLITPMPSLPAGYFTYRVRPGDTIDKIAAMFNLSSWEIESANPWAAGITTLEVGRTVEIPPPGLLTPAP
jgi:LysM repeat protein